MDPTYTRPDHLKMLSEYLMKVVRGEIKRLIIEMPPRHGKSETTSVKFPPYYLGKFPRRRVMLASYAGDLATRLSSRARDTLKEFGPEVFGVSVSEDAAAKNQWDVMDPHAPKGSPPGGMIAAGVGGPMTGHGYHLGIIDDPIKDAKEANSQTIRDNIWDWYRYVFRTRIMDEGAIIVMMTRWHEDDLVGRLLKSEEDGESEEGWVVLKLPALAEESDPMGRKIGDALWPAKYTATWLKATARAVGTYVWSALYQQRPSPAGGSIFQSAWFRYFYQDQRYYHLRTGVEGAFKIKKVDKTRCWVFQTCDTAATEEESSDYFVNSTWAVTPENDLLLLNVFREKAETTKHEYIMETEARRWRPRFQGIEKKSFGLNLIQSLKRKGMPVRPLKADIDKVSRARPMAARYEIGAVYHLEEAPWLSEYESELVKFPNGQHDDQVDTAGYAGIVISERPTSGGVRNKPPGF